MLAKLDYADRHYLNRARYALNALGREDEFEAVKAAHWRHKNGLEQRCLVALICAPEVLPEARVSLSPRDFLTPAYAALAALLLTPEGESLASVASSALVGRPYLPDADTHPWAAEAREAISRLGERRERWSRRKWGGGQPG